MQVWFVWLGWWALAIPCGRCGELPVVFGCGVVGMADVAVMAGVVGVAGVAVWRE